jgi:hypothetical protein
MEFLPVRLKDAARQAAAGSTRLCRATGAANVRLRRNQEGLLNGEKAKFSGSASHIAIISR